MGMRASGSHDVVFTDCFIPEGEIEIVGPLGVYSEWQLTAGRTSTGKLLAESYAIQHTMAEIEIELATMRAVLARTALASDAFFSTYPPGAAPLDDLRDLMKDFQCTKWIVNRKAIDIVDKALQLSGGSGYLGRSPFSRLYRDVRAGPFMQPYSPNEAFQYIGKQSLGLEAHVE